jgi:hypothetical protein
MGIQPPFPDDVATGSQWFSGTAHVLKEYHMLENLKSTTVGSLSCRLFGDEPVKNACPVLGKDYIKSASPSRPCLDQAL